MLPHRCNGTMNVILGGSARYARLGQHSCLHPCRALYASLVAAGCRHPAAAGWHFCLLARRPPLLGFAAPRARGGCCPFSHLLCGARPCHAVVGPGVHACRRRPVDAQVPHGSLCHCVALCPRAARGGALQPSRSCKFELQVPPNVRAMRVRTRKGGGDCFGCSSSLRSRLLDRHHGGHCRFHRFGLRQRLVIKQPIF